jgi:predicted RNA binding protein YcfA (HicA-like mRNA interferase family)
MSSNPEVKHKDAKRVAKRLGFTFRNTVGSHEQYKNMETGRKTTIPNYKESYGDELIKNICRQMDIKKATFFEYMKK